MKRAYLVCLLLLLTLCLLTLVSCGEHVHEYGEWTTTRAATCTEDGVKSCSCTCGDVRTQPLRATGHRLTFTYQNDATFTEDGTALVACRDCDYTDTRTALGTAQHLRSAFDGKTVSILGDSISTFLDVSNGAAADTGNSTVRDGVLYYDAQKIRDLGVDLEDTWWQRTIDTIGATLLVNNSWSGSYIKDTSTNTRPTAGAYLTRATELHDDTGANAGQEPDIILVYMGTNDYYKYYANVGDVSALDPASLAAQIDNPSYAPSSLMEAYALMLLRMQAAYEDAEIYCLNVLESSLSDTASLTVFNGMLRSVAQALDVIYVDICENSGIRAGDTYETFVPSDDGDGTKNSLHPNAQGMERIADCVIDAILENTAITPPPFTMEGDNIQAAE